jgi:hypothetical protein
MLWGRSIPETYLLRRLFLLFKYPPSVRAAKPDHATVPLSRSQHRVRMHLSGEAQHTFSEAATRLLRSFRSEKRKLSTAGPCQRKWAWVEDVRAHQEGSRRST